MFLVWFQGGYFDYHKYGGRFAVTSTGEDVAGNIKPRPYGLITSGYPIAMVHELAHTYGIVNEDYEDGRDKPVFEGFDATLKTLVANAISIMAGSHISSSFSDYWFNPDVYNVILKNSMKESFDPPVVYVSGVVRVDGSVRIFESGMSSKGTLSEDEHGDLVINILSKSGTVLSTVSALTKITAYLSSIDGSNAPAKEELEIIPFVVSLPYFENATDFEIVKNGVVLSKKPIGYATPTPTPTPTPTYSIKEIVSKLPNSSFKAFPVLSRAVLNIQAIAGQSLIDAKKYSQAIVLLKLIDAELRLIVKDKYSTTNSQLTKKQALESIEQLITVLSELERKKLTKK